MISFVVRKDKRDRMRSVYQKKKRDRMRSVIIFCFNILFGKSIK